jgi:hypothetical protein
MHARLTDAETLQAAGSAADLAYLLALLVYDSLPMCRALSLLSFHLLSFHLLSFFFYWLQLLSTALVRCDKAGKRLGYWIFSWTIFHFAEAYIPYTCFNILYLLPYRAE